MKLGRTIFVSAAIAFAAINSASAADLPQGVTAYRAPYATLFTWTGCYLGGNAGYGWAHAAATVTVAGVSATGSENLDGFVGGGQLGCNYQANSFVFGVEGDFQGSSQSKTTSVSGLGVTLTERDSLPWFGTVRGRVGVAIDTWLFYATGGGGYGEFKTELTATGLVVGSLTATRDHSFWVAGVGMEKAFMRSWSTKIEYLHLDTGSITNNGSIAGVAIASSAKVTDDIVRLGLNYHF